MSSSVGPVVFDCDGTLVDSESLSARTNAAVFALHGAVMTPDEAWRRYNGVILDRVVADVSARFGIALPEDILDELDAALDALAETELAAIPGAKPLLDRLFDEGAGLAVASNSRRASVERSLRLTGLSHYFGDRLATADQVPYPKPAPDVYLLAANHLAAAPAECTAIEDSVTGITAARAAGMRVIGYKDPAHSHGAEALLAAGAHHVVSNLDEIAPILGLSR